MSTESIRQFPSTVSFDSPLQVPQLVEDQLSEDALESVVGGVLYEAVAEGNRSDLSDPMLGGNGPILPIPGRVPGPGPGPGLKPLG